MRNQRLIPAASLVLVGALLAAALPLLAPPADAVDGSTKLMVLGETHGTKSMTKSLINIAASKGAVGCVCPGDFIYGDWGTSASAWRDMMRPFAATMMPAQGNHDYPWSDWSGMFPDGQSYYEKEINGVQFISVNTERSLASGSSQRVWLEARLAESDASALKVVFLHRPWWLPSGAIHPSSEFESKNGASAATMDALMVKHGVDLVVSAHEKNHQHSLRNGVHYLVAGGGGPEFTSMGYSLPGAVKRLGSSVVSTLDVSATSMTLKSYDLSWRLVDEFTMSTTSSGGETPSAGSGTPPPPPAVTFAPSGGNEWWVQTKVAGAAPRLVEARAGEGSWHALTLRSWGAWATSFHVAPGATVTYRATFADGSAATSCAYAHPSATCASGGTASPEPTPTPASPPPSAFSATFRNARGNAWWVEANVDATGLAAVDARVNGGSWIALSTTSWGSWAKSLSAPAGSTVEMRARSADGQVASSPVYAWPPSG